MSTKDMLLLALTHPLEFRTLVQFKIYHGGSRDLSAPSEHATSGWDPVVKELEGDLARVVCLFYLVLRGLDTVEDDMTIPDDIKDPILRSFHEKTVTPGWHFEGSGPNEKDRQLLVEYQNVVEELNLLEPRYRNVIVDTCQKMENGMADFAHKAATTGSIYLEKIEDYDLYCHYVAGLVGEGLSGLLAASGKESPWLAQQLSLSGSMGLFLQKTNITRDFREDVDERRFFWPREIWGRPEYGLGGFREMAEIHAAGNEQRGLWALNGMVADALRHAPDCLDYLRLLRNQSAFNFCAIPQTMAIATLELVFMNPAVLQRNVKIRKAAAARLIMRSTNPHEVAYIFRDFARKIHAKAVPADPNFMRIAVACGKIEQWCEQQYPSFVTFEKAQFGQARQGFDASDARTRIVQLEKERDQEIDLARRLGGGVGQQPLAGSETSNKEVFTFIFLVVIIVLVVSLGIVYATIKLADYLEL